MKREQNLLLLCAAATMLGAAVIAVIVYALRPDYESLRKGRVDEDYLTSKDCKRCHEDRYTSWSRTYHSRMTQEARPESIQGDFTRDNTLDYMDVHATMEVRDGQHVMAMSFPDGKSRTYTIDRTVGSRRIEQYLTKEAGQYTRLPVAYDLVNRRWMSLNGSFFYPDGDNYLPAPDAVELELRVLSQRQGAAAHGFRERQVQDRGDRTWHRVRRLSWQGGEAR